MSAAQWDVVLILGTISAVWVIGALVYDFVVEKKKPEGGASGADKKVR